MEPIPGMILVLYFVQYFLKCRPLPVPFPITLYRPLQLFLPWTTYYTDANESGGLRPTAGILTRMHLYGWC
jgi:hypothetical protein